MRIGLKIAIGFSVGAAMIAVLGIVGFRNAQVQTENTWWETHTYQVLYELDNTLSALKDAETGQRGFIITGRDEYLEPYSAGVRAERRGFDALAALTRDNPTQQQHLEQVRPLIDAKLAELQETIRLRKERGLQAALPIILSNRGKKTMDDIRSVFDQMERHERHLMEVRTQAADASAQGVKWTILFGTPLSFLILGLVGFVLTRHIGPPLASLTRAALRISQGDLSTPLAPMNRTDEAGVLQQSFVQMTEWLHKMAGYAEQIARQDLTVEVVPLSERDELGNSFSSMVTNLRTSTEELQQRSEELAQQNEELAQQSEELSQQNEELTQQSEELALQNEEIQALNAEVTRRENLLQTLVNSTRLLGGEHAALREICKAAIDIFGGSVATVAIYEKRDDQLMIRAIAGLGEESFTAESRPVVHTFVETAIQQDKTACMPDASLRPDLSLLQIPGQPPFQSVCSSPMRRDGLAFGAVSLYSIEKQDWTDEQFHMAEWFAGQCSGILETLRLQTELHRQNAVLHGINSIFHESLTRDSEEEVCRACLTVAERLTGSMFGFVGEIGEDGYLHDIAISNPGWELCAMHDKTGHRRPTGNFTIHGLYGRVLTDGKSLLTNVPFSHPDSIGVPEGHPSLSSFLGVPLSRAGRTVGMIAVANRAAGYRPEDVSVLEALAPAVLEALTYKRAEKALKNAHDELELRVQERTEALRRQADLLELAYNAIIVRDLDSKVTFWNARSEALYGFGRDEALGRIAHTLLHTQFPVPYEQHMAALTKEGRWEGELTHTRKDGRQIVVLSRQALQRDESGQPVAIMEINLDISERKRADEEIKRYASQLELSNRELQDFAFVASHDLQEPLRKIQAFGDRLKTGYSERLDAKGMDFLGRMQSAAVRMQALIQALLTYSRVTTKAQPFSITDLGKIAREVADDLETRMVETGGRLEIGDLPQIEADPTQMRQLIQNLVGNALKFHGDEKPVVKVYSRKAGQERTRDGRYLIFVEDNGIGFDEKYLDRIFTPFQRLHGREEYEGTGIGLAICRKIVDRHGGSITARSAVGKGTTFIVTLPMKQPKGGTA
ncbi:MAG: CHASE3 domain-containing protein [Syntrophorhabdales bacterium]|jgi:PAS domain S-box-containing protein